MEKEKLLRIQSALEKSSELRPTEILLGYVPVDYPFSKVTYSATVTRAIELNPYDRAICGILAIQDGLSREEIGRILGFQVENIPSQKRYADPAELDILQSALESLQEFGMIEGGDTEFSYCYLTQVGKEYFAKKKKFREYHSKTFELYFDQLSSDHSKTKQALKNQLCEEIASAPEGDIDFSNETLVRYVARHQVPDVYQPEAEFPISFKDFEVVKEMNCEVKVFALLLLNLHTKKMRWHAFFPNSSKLTTYFQSIFEDITPDLIKKMHQTISLTRSSPNNVTDSFPEAEPGVPYLLDLDESLSSILAVQEDKGQELKKWQEKLLSAPLLSELFFWNHWQEMPGSGVIQETWLFVHGLPNAVIKKWIASGKIEQVATQSESVFILFDQSYFDKIELESLNSIPNLTISFIEIQQNITLWSISDQEFISWKTQTLPVLIEVSPSEILEAQHTFVSKGHDMSVNDQFYQKTKQSVCRNRFEEMYAELNNVALRKEDYDSLVEAAKLIDNLYQESSRLGFGLDESQDELFSQIKRLLTEKQELLSREFWKSASYLDRSWKRLTKNKNPHLYDVADLGEIEGALGRLVEVKDMITDTKGHWESLRQSYSDLQQTISKARAAQEKVSYVIDTNVFIEIPEIIDLIPEKDVPVVSAKVVDELDRHKRNRDKNVARSAKHAIGNLKKYVSRNSKRKVQMEFADQSLLPSDLDNQQADNLILSVALKLKENAPILLTNDKGLHLKAEMLDIKYLTTHNLLSLFKKDKN
jgi:rRNA-processing protein FCF1